MAEEEEREVEQAPPPVARCAPGWWRHGAGDKPARIQLDLSKVRLQAAEVSGDYNIWYSRYSGDAGRQRSAPAATRCHLDTDAGLTQADYTNSQSPLCFHFARGACAYGSNCTYRHRAPLDDDETNMESRLDVFGRERHGSFKDDMGGVGSWSQDNRTLYVGRICVTPTESEVHATVYNHFSEWGDIDYCRVLMQKGCAFVAYRTRAAAEFAKEAMMDQSLEHGEQLNVRWAYEDPNPRAKAEKLRIQANVMLDAMRKRGHVGSKDVAQVYGSLQEASDDAKRPRTGEPAGPVAGPAPRPQAADVPPVVRNAEAGAAPVGPHEPEQSARTKLESILGRIDGPAAEPDEGLEHAPVAAEYGEAVHTLPPGAGPSSGN